MLHYVALFHQCLLKQNSYMLKGSVYFQYIQILNKNCATDTFIYFSKYQLLNKTKKNPPWLIPTPVVAEIRVRLWQLLIVFISSSVSWLFWDTTAVNEDKQGSIVKVTTYTLIQVHFKYTSMLSMRAQKKTALRSYTCMFIYYIERTTDSFPFMISDLWPWPILLDQFDLIIEGEKKKKKNSTFTKNMIPRKLRICQSRHYISPRMNTRARYSFPRKKKRDHIWGEANVALLGMPFKAVTLISQCCGNTKAWQLVCAVTAGSCMEARLSDHPSL